MKIISVCNAGLYLEKNGFGLLVDGVERGAASFLPTPQRTMAEFRNRSSSYHNLQAFAFTHEHPDHYDAEMLASIPFAGSDNCFLPWRAGKESSFQAGPFAIRATAIPHMPFPGTIIHNYAFLINAGESGNILITGDSACDPQALSSFIGSFHITHCFLNHTYLSNENGRSWLSEMNPDHLYLYHVPEDPLDGIHKKALSVLRKESINFQNLILIDSYPTVLYNQD